jgi:small subunit ribosomal protein S16
MTVVIRMKRSGRKNRPCYRISVADARSPRDGRTIESLGFYDPISPRPESQVSIDVERARYWLERGAQPSDTVRSILKRSGVAVVPAVRPARERPGRKRETKTGQNRIESKTARQAAKAERVAALRQARRAAAKEAAAAKA